MNNPPPPDHPLAVADSGESKKYRAIFEQARAALEVLGASGVALVGVFPHRDTCFVVSSVANQAPVTRHILIDAIARETERWHLHMEQKGKH